MTIDRVRQSLRLLARHKRFSALAMISLGLAIALNTTMYSVLDAMISPKLAMREPEQLWRFQFVGDRRGLFSLAEKNLAYRDELSFHEGITGSVGSFEAQVVETGHVLREANVLTIAPNYFAVLGVRASAGRLLSAPDLTVSGRPVVVSERLWRQLFPDRDFTTATISLEGEPRTIVGMLPYEADFPGSYTDIWQLPPTYSVATMPLTLTRLKPGVTPDQAWAELEVLRKRFATRTGEINAGDGGFLFKSATKPPYRVGRFHLALVGAVVSVLLIACANLANLQLARGVSRSRELATRAAVGATRADIIRQLLLESGWLAIGGLAIGAVLTVWGMSLVEHYVPPSIADYVTRPQLSWRVMLFAIGATVFCLLLVGLAPAIKLSRVNISELMKAGAGTGKSKSMRRQYGALVIAEISLALIVLCSASLLVISSVQVAMSGSWRDVSRDVMGSFIGVVPSGPADRRTRADWNAFVIRRALSAPEFTSAAVVTSARPRKHAVSLDDPSGVPRVVAVGAWGYSVVTADYLRTMNIGIERGRDFSVNEDAEAGVIVDQTTASFLWPGTDPVGRLIKFDSAQGPSPWLKVIGVAKAKRNQQYEYSITRLPGMSQVYVLATRDTTPVRISGHNGRFGYVFNLVARGTGDNLKLSLNLRRALGNLDDTRNYVMAPSSDAAYFDRKLARYEFMASLFALFGVMALALAALGVYAIIAHMVAQRTREFGVRIAIGAGARDIRKLVVGEGNVLALAGIALGLVATPFAGILLRVFLQTDDDRFDSRIFAVTCLVLFASAWLASYIPARRAMRINPVEALRND